MNKRSGYVGWLILISIGVTIIVGIEAYKIFGRTSWDWGSFVGGAIGGIGTLIAVCVTTSQTRKIQNENNKHIKNEKEQKTYQNLLIIYYDLRFALLAIFEFTKKFLADPPKGSTPDIDKGLLTNIYLDKEWIHTIPKTSGILSSEQIGQVYNSYGKIFDLLDCINNKDEFGDKDIEAIEKCVITFYKKPSNDMVLQEEIRGLITYLEDLLSKYDSNSIDSKLIDELIGKGCEVQL